MAIMPLESFPSRGLEEDVTSGEKTEQGTNGRLRGTHVYGVSIDRSKEPVSAKTMIGITEFSDFE